MALFGPTTYDFPLSTVFLLELGTLVLFFAACNFLGAVAPRIHCYPKFLDSKWSHELLCSRRRTTASSLDGVFDPYCGSSDGLAAGKHSTGAIDRIGTNLLTSQCHHGRQDLVCSLLPGAEERRNSDSVSRGQNLDDIENKTISWQTTASALLGFLYPYR